MSTRTAGLRSLMAILVLLAVSAFRSPVNASERGGTVAARFCQVCEEGSGGGGETGHSFQAPGASFTCGPHTTGCHVEWLSGTCGAWHTACIEGPAPEVLQVVDLARSGDAKQIRQLLARYPSRFRFNADRASIQVFGCDKIVTAQISVGTEIASQLE